MQDLELRRKVCAIMGHTGIKGVSVYQNAERPIDFAPDENANDALEVVKFWEGRNPNCIFGVEKSCDKWLADFETKLPAMHKDWRRANAFSESLPIAICQAFLKWNGVLKNEWD